MSTQLPPPLYSKTAVRKFFGEQSVEVHTDCSIYSDLGGGLQHKQQNNQERLPDAAYGHITATSEHSSRNLRTSYDVCSRPPIIIFESICALFRKKYPNREVKVVGKGHLSYKN